MGLGAGGLSACFAAVGSAWLGPRTSARIEQEKKFLSRGARGNPEEGLRGCESPCAFCMTPGTEWPLVPGLGQSHSFACYYC